MINDSNPFPMVGWIKMAIAWVMRVPVVNIIRKRVPTTMYHAEKFKNPMLAIFLSISRNLKADRSVLLFAILVMAINMMGIVSIV